jgi:Gamma tubulin complex component C-terminal
VAVHAVSCLESYLHDEMARASFSTLQEPGAAPPRDVLELMRSHTRFCSTCAERAMLASEPQLAAATSSLLESCLTVEGEARERVLRDVAGVVPGERVPTADAAKRVAASGAWLEGATEALQQRVAWLRTTLEGRTGGAGGLARHDEFPCITAGC